MKTVHSFDYATGLYLGTVVLGDGDLSPLEPDVYLVPGNCVEVAPPEPGDGQYVVHVDGQWELRETVAVLPETPPVPSPEEVAARFIDAIQLRLDTFARSRRYDNILSACTYAASSNPKFQAEGQACVNLRDSTWAAAYAILEQVEAGQRPVPDDLADIEDDLPALEWPQ